MDSLTSSRMVRGRNQKTKNHNDNTKQNHTYTRPRGFCRATLGNRFPKLRIGGLPAQPRGIPRGLSSYASPWQTRPADVAMGFRPLHHGRKPCGGGPLRVCWPVVICHHKRPHRRFLLHRSIFPDGISGGRLCCSRPCHMGILPRRLRVYISRTNPQSRPPGIRAWHCFNLVLKGGNL